MVEAFNQGPGPLIGALYDQLGMGQTIDEMVRWDPHSAGFRRGCGSKRW